MKKVLSSDEIYDLIGKSNEIIWNGEQYKVFFHNEEYVVLHPITDVEEIEVPYEEIENDLKSNDDSYIEFYQLKRIEIGE